MSWCKHTRTGKAQEHNSLSEDASGREEGTGAFRCLGAKRCHQSTHTSAHACQAPKNTQINPTCASNPRNNNFEQYIQACKRALSTQLKPGFNTDTKTLGTHTQKNLGAGLRCCWRRASFECTDRHAAVCLGHVLARRRAPSARCFGLFFLTRLCTKASVSLGVSNGLSQGQC